MISRRTFINKLIFGSIASSLINFQTVIAKSSALLNVPDQKGPAWDKTIFCIVDDPVLERALEKLAREINCEVLFDWPYSPELIFDHHFVSVINGSIIEESAWDLYVDCCEEGEILARCLLFGNITHLRKTKAANISIITSDNAHKDIMYAIDKWELESNILFFTKDNTHENIMYAIKELKCDFDICVRD